MNEILQKDKACVWHPFTPLLGSPEPVCISRGKGVYLYTEDGRKIIDAISSWWVNIHGHAHPDIAKAIGNQALQLEHVIFAGFTHEPAVCLAENLLRILPGNQQKIFFSDNGSTAVEVALKMAFQYWHNKGERKTKLIAIEGAYHGDTFGAMSVGSRNMFTDPFLPFLFDVTFVDFPSAGHENAVVQQFEQLVQEGDVAAFIYEPLIQGASGMRTYSAACLDALIELAQKHGVVCIADEVFTGFGRTGKFFASDHLKYQPDIISVSKGITGGFLPLGVTGCSAKVVKAFETEDFSKTFFHGHSYTANPIACAAANASFKLLIDPACMQNIERINRQHRRFQDKIMHNRHLRRVNVLGTILSIEIDQGASTYANDIRKKIYAFFLDRGIYLRPLGNVIYVVPPYVITDDELETIYSAIQHFLESL